MVRALGFLLISTSAFAAVWKPHPIKVIAGVPLKAQDIKPYTPPKLKAEPPLEPTDVKVVEVTVPEAAIEIRPWSSPMVGNAIQGARLAIRGVVSAKGRGCSGKVWYALEPFGYVCSREVRPTSEPATTEQVVQMREGMRLPFQYVMALIKEGDKLPMWASLEELKKGEEPERELEKGDTIAVEKPIVWENQKYWLTVEQKIIPQKGFSLMGAGASWHGLQITDAISLPFGWTLPEKTNAYAVAPEASKTKPDAVLDRRTRVNIVDEKMVGKKKWLKVTFAEAAPPATFGEIFSEVERKKAKTSDAAVAPPAPENPNPLAALPEAWVLADSVNEVRKLERPPTVRPEIDRWIDVDLGEQVLVAYEADKPVFATIVASGRAIPTPMGTYPVWAKVSAITMKNQPYEDKEYFVNKVPWSTFFQWHNAIHGAYWHDRFGAVKSHGCVNVAPLDAKWVFEWVTPPLPPGWTGLRPLELLKSPHVVVRNSHMKNQFRQDRPIGPPDRELESQRLEEAEQRRADEEAAAQTVATPTPGNAPATTPTPVPAPTPSAP